MSLVFLIPGEWMAENIAVSAERLSHERPGAALYPWCTSELATRTDSLMLLNAAYQDDSKSLVDQAMFMYRNHAGADAHEALVLQYAQGEPAQQVKTYPRYWHGYLVWLKPVMCLMSYQPFRYLNGAIQNSLLLLLVFLMLRKGLKAYILPVLLTAGMLMPVLLAKSMQCSSCYYLMLLGCLAVAACKERLLQAEAFIFLYIGIGVAFFDFLTYPIVTVGVPAALCFAIHSGPGWKDDFVRLARICFCWCFGYGGMWLGKWCAGSLLTGENFITSALRMVSYRVSNSNLDSLGVSGSHATVYTVIENWKAFWRTPVTYLVCIFLAVLAVVYLIRVFQNRARLKALQQAAILGLIACMPLVWYLVLVNHSAIHVGFTNKSLAVIPFALMTACVKLVESAKQSQ